MDLVTNLSEIVENLLTLKSYGSSLNFQEKEGFRKLIKKGICFVVYYENGHVIMGPSKFIGYKQNELFGHGKIRGVRDGGKTNKAIGGVLGCEPSPDKQLDKEYLIFCERFGIDKPDKGSFGKQRKFWVLKNEKPLQILNPDKQNLDIDDFKNIFVPAPKMSSNITKSKLSRKGVSKHPDYELAQTIGKEGEIFVLEVEKVRLSQLGRADLAKKIKWTSQDIGDQEGYDILSYDDKGKEIYIEVKTTQNGKEAPFWITSNELAFYKAHVEQYRLYRVFNFRTSTRIFILQGLLEMQVKLSPSVFIAKF